MMGEWREQVLTRGYCVVDRIFDEAERKAIDTIIKNVWRRFGQPDINGSFGFSLPPLFECAPELARFWLNDTYLAVLRDVLDDQPLIEHAGALLVGNRREFCPWHDHLGGQDRGRQPRQVLWQRYRSQHPTRIQRVNGNIYLDGSNEANGQLLLIPRRVDDPLSEPIGDLDQEWPGQVVVDCPPASLIVFDEAVWHAARRPKMAEGNRILWGAFFIGANTPIADDHDDFSKSYMQSLYETYPDLRPLTRGNNAT